MVYETDVGGITELLSTGYFKLKFGPDSSEYDCRFIKNTDKNLLLLCTLHYEEGNYTFGEITQEVEVDNVNIKYNFVIPEVMKNDEIFELGSLRGNIYDFSQPELDFTKNEEINLWYTGDDPTSPKKLRLNPEGNELQCESKREDYILCKVPKSHFNGKKTGLYYIHYENYKGGMSTSYGVHPIKVILNNGFYNRLSLFLLGTILLCLI